MSPLRTLISCGSSSRLVRRRKRPARVMRGSSGILKAGSSSFSRSTSSASCCSASATIVRNLSIVKGTPSLPARLWRKKTGMPESMTISSAIAANRGESTASIEAETEQAVVLGEEGEAETRPLALLDQPLGVGLAHLLLGDDDPLDVVGARHA